MGENALYLGSQGQAEGLVVDGVEIPNIDADAVISVEFAKHSFPRVTVTLVAPGLTVIADSLVAEEVPQSAASGGGGAV